MDKVGIAWRVGALLLCGFGACAPTPAAHDRRNDAGAQPVGSSLAWAGEIVAKVGGQDITRAQLEHRARADGVGARQALDSLVREELLLAEAMRRGYGQRREVIETVRRASVRRLLSEIERAVPADTIGDAAIHARFEESLARYDQPERRDVVHVLLPLPAVADDVREEQGRVRMTRVAGRLRSASSAERERLLEEFERDPQLQVESVPAVARTTPFDQAFIRAIFSLDEPGIVPSPVRAYDGWHVVWVRRIEPATTPDFDLHRDDVFRDLLAEARSRRLAALLRALRSRASVEMNEERIRTRLARIPAAP